VQKCRIRFLPGHKLPHTRNLVPGTQTEGVLAHTRMSIETNHRLTDCDMLEVPRHAEVRSGTYYESSLRKASKKESTTMSIENNYTVPTTNDTRDERWRQVNAISGSEHRASSRRVFKICLLDFDWMAPRLVELKTVIM
jgi:hypothetical protein